MKQLYTNGTIVTMTGSKDTAEAVLVENGVILAVGTAAERGNAGAERIDLGGQTLLPAFIDAHSHLTAYAETLGLCCLTGARSFRELVDRLRLYLEENVANTGEWLCGFGYDAELLAEKRHPDRFTLDEVSREIPVMISNVSGHMGVVNSKALTQLSIGRDTPDPEGGKIGRRDGVPDGYLEENAFFGLRESAPKPELERRLTQLVRAQDAYFSRGITTIQDGLTDIGSFLTLQTAAERGMLKADVVCYPDMLRAGHLTAEHSEYRTYRRGLKIGGYKIILDGSPQGRTAYLTAPYEGERNDYRGYPALSDDKLLGLVQEAAGEGAQLLAHCNGDAAAEQFLSAVERTPGAEKIRTVMIHSQTVRPDQVKRMKAAGMIPSFFVAHIYYFGDTHLKNLGARAYAISPAASAIEHGVVYTFHQDTPVLMPDMLRTVSSAVNRVTESGVELGREQRITPYEALCGVTKHAAFQYFEEDKKGTIEPGKNADFVVLDRNPLATPQEELAGIQVIRTVKGGRVLYER